MPTDVRGQFPEGEIRRQGHPRTLSPAISNHTSVGSMVARCSLVRALPVSRSQSRTVRDGRKTAAGAFWANFTASWQHTCQNTSSSKMFPAFSRSVAATGPLPEFVKLLKKLNYHTDCQIVMAYHYASRKKKEAGPAGQSPWPDRNSAAHQRTGNKPAGSASVWELSRICPRSRLAKRTEQSTDTERRNSCQETSSALRARRSAGTEETGPRSFAYPATSGIRAH